MVIKSHTKSIIEELNTNATCTKRKLNFAPPVVWLVTEWMSVHHHHATGALPATRKTPNLTTRVSCAALSVDLVTPQGTRSAQNATSPHDYFYKGAESRLNDVLFNMPQHLRNSNTKKILNLHLGAFPGADLGTVRGADQEAKPEGPHNLGATVTRRPPGSPPKPVIHWR